MPSYISHSIMSEALYNGLDNKDNINVSDLRFFSYMPDLLSTKIDNHNIKVKQYFVYLLRYIKIKHLENDSNVMGYLYGFICHYYMDSLCHPFIYSLQFSTSGGGFSHYLIEGYLNQYLSREILGKDLIDIDDHYLSGCVNNKTIDLINSSFSDIYGIDTFSDMRTNSFLIRGIHFISKFVHDKSFLRFISGFNRFLKNNRLNEFDLDNRFHNRWTNPFTLDSSTSSFKDLYNDSICLSMETIDLDKEYFRDEVSIKEVVKRLDKSYDTGTVKPLEFYKK